MPSSRIRLTWSLPKHILTATALARENGGFLPLLTWLRANGYAALEKCIRAHSSEFAHIARERNVRRPCHTPLDPEYTWRLRYNALLSVAEIAQRHDVLRDHVYWQLRVYRNINKIPSRKPSIDIEEAWHLRHIQNLSVKDIAAQRAISVTAVQRALRRAYKTGYQRPEKIKINATLVRKLYFEDGKTISYIAKLLDVGSTRVSKAIKIGKPEPKGFGPIIVAELRKFRDTVAENLEPLKREAHSKIKPEFDWRTDTNGAWLDLAWQLYSQQQMTLREIAEELSFGHVRIVPAQITRLLRDHKVYSDQYKLVSAERSIRAFKNQSKDIDIVQLLTMRQNGQTYQQISNTTGISLTHIHRMLHNHPENIRRQTDWNKGRISKHRKVDPDKAVKLRDEGWSYAAIGNFFGATKQAAIHAVNRDHHKSYTDSRFGRGYQRKAMRRCRAKKSRLPYVR